VCSIIVDGIVWGEEFKIVDVAYGIQKLIVQVNTTNPLFCAFWLPVANSKIAVSFLQVIIEDEKILLQDIEDKFEALTEIVQSFDMLSMNKVSGK
jgi:translation elongation factor EF-1beta